MNDGEISSRQHGVGRPHAIKEKSLRRLSCMVKQNRNQTVAQLTAQYNAGPSRTESEHTVQRTLLDMGLRSKLLPIVIANCSCVGQGNITPLRVLTFFRVSAADKGCRVYPLDPRPDAVALYSGCTLGKGRAWYLSDDRHTASLVRLRGGWSYARKKMFTRTYGSNAAVPGGVISEPDLLTTSESEILEGFSYQGAIQVRRITIKKNTTVFPTKHLILTFNSPNLPTSIKAGYLNCKIRPYIPNPLRCFKCQRFGHSQTSCRGQLICSRCASVGHSSTDCTLEPKCINCSEPHPSDSRFCPKWKIEKQIQEIKANKNLSYPEARKLIVPQKTQIYAQVVKTLTTSTATQTDDTISQIICPPLKLLQRVPRTSSSVLAISTSSTQINLLMSTSSTAASISETRTHIPTSIPVPPSTVSRDQTSSSAPAKSQDIKENSKRKTRKNPVKTTNQPEIEIKLAPHKPRKSLPIRFLGRRYHRVRSGGIRLTRILDKISRKIFKYVTETVKTNIYL
ncbi:uncharacterized protein TNCV_3781621 [Trichonephila clavipes]|nr:uncharacterized protein TNCV_3781621 [Trichonephila clavipes]